jgi:hypothetical protein
MSELIGGHWGSCWRFVRLGSGNRGLSSQTACLGALHDQCAAQPECAKPCCVPVMHVNDSVRHCRRTLSGGAPVAGAG